MVFNIKGYEEIIDIVPSLRADFVRGKNEYILFKNPFFFKDSTKLKMNPHKQRDLGDFEVQKIEVIKLIKILKNKEKLPIKSILITQLTKKAFKEIRMPEKLNKKLISILEFIRDNIKTTRIMSPDNPRICLSDSLSFKEKEEIKKALDEVLFNLKNDKNYLLDYFPEKF